MAPFANLDELLVPSHQLAAAESRTSSIGTGPHGRCVSQRGNPRTERRVRTLVRTRTWSTPVMLILWALIAVAAAIAAGWLTNLLTPASHGISKRVLLMGLCAAVVVGAIATWQLQQGSTTAPLASPTTPSEPTASPSTASFTQATVLPAPSSITSTTIPDQTSAPPQSDYLFDLSPIDGSYQIGSKSVSGTTYQRSIFHGLSECNAGDGKGFRVEYNLGRKYSRFIASAGLSDVDTHGSRTVQFRIDTDRKHDDFVVGRGELHKVDFDLTGALFVRLTVYEQNGSGACIIDAVAVWGDAQIRP
jgi:NPCBM/NEW2 domain